MGVLFCMTRSALCACMCASISCMARNPSAKDVNEYCAVFSPKVLLLVCEQSVEEDCATSSYKWRSTPTGMVFMPAADAEAAPDASLIQGSWRWHARGLVRMYRAHRYIAPVSNGAGHIHTNGVLCIIPSPHTLPRQPYRRAYSWNEWFGVCESKVIPVVWILHYAPAGMQCRTACQKGHGKVTADKRVHLLDVGHLFLLIWYEFCILYIPQFSPNEILTNYNIYKYIMLMTFSGI